MDLEGRFALVTGASGGIGFETAKKLLQAGASVGAHYSGEREGAAVELASLTEYGQSRSFKADFSDSSQVMRLWDEFIAWADTIDILVNNAGQASDPTSYDELSEVAWDRTFAVNVKAPFLLSRAAMAVMRAKSFGRIINISSIGVKFGGGRTTVHYSASKAALEAVTRSLSKVGAPDNVLVNVIRAGVTDTPFHERIGITDLTQRTELIPMRRIARPEEIADAVLYLSSAKSSYVAGSVLTVAGGE